MRSDGKEDLVAFLAFLVLFAFMALDVWVYGGVA